MEVESLGYSFDLIDQVKGEFLHILAYFETRSFLDQFE